MAKLTTASPVPICGVHGDERGSTCLPWFSQSDRTGRHALRLSDIGFFVRDTEVLPSAAKRNAELSEVDSRPFNVPWLLARIPRD